MSIRLLLTGSLSKLAPGRLLSRGPRITLALVALSGACSTVLAQPAPADAPAPPARHPLEGPGVDDLDLPGRGRTFGEGMDHDRKRVGRPNPRLYMDAVRSLSDPETPDSLRLTQEQEEAVREIVSEFQREARAFRDQRGEELRSLRERAGMGDRERGPGGPPPPPEGASPRKGQRADRGARSEPTVDQRAARQQLKELMAQGPDLEGYQARLWGALRPEQREAANQRMEELRREKGPMAPRNQRGGPEGRGPQARGPGGGGDERGGPPAWAPRRGPEGREDREGPGGPPARPEPRAEHLMERLRDRLESMSPEQRDQAMQRLERWLDEREGPGPRPQRGPGGEPRPRQGGPGGPPPPPPMDDDRSSRASDL